MVWFIYLADVLPCISSFFGIIGTLCSFIGVFMFIKAVDEKEFKLAFRAWIFGFIFIVTASFIPSKEALYRMYAVGKIEEFVTNDDVIKQIPRKAIECLDKWLDEQLKEDF